MTILRLLGGLCGGLMLLLVGHAQESSAKRDSENIKQRTLGACSSETVRGANSASMIGEIVGFYKEPVSNALLEKDTPTSLRHNYLAISTMQDGSLRIRLSTKERNGHNCGFDSKALLCGQTIYLLPNRDEAEQLGRTGQEPPALLVSKNQIRFRSKPDGTFHFGTPYCGSMGGLNEAFSRKSKRSKIIEEVFEKQEDVK